MLNRLKRELDNRGVFKTKLPDFLIELANTIPTNLPEKMKLTISVSALITFTSMFRRNIQHYNGSLIPINAITFCISNSGSGKDSSVNAMKKNFNESYEVIQRIRIDKAIEKAKEEAKSKRLAKANEPVGYSKCLKNPLPLFVATSTPEGFIRYLNELDEEGIGSGSIYVGEFGDELMNSSSIISILQLLSELYDEGKKELKVLKSQENQSKEIKNLPVSGLFITSPDNIIYNEDIKKKFKLQFTSKLARRSFFTYINEKLDTNDNIEISDVLSRELELTQEAIRLRKKHSDRALELTKELLTKLKQPISIEPKAKELYILYKAYNEALSDTLNSQYSISKIATRHLYWKALKLSGAIAIYKGEDSISEQSYREAIAFTELLTEDMKNFEIELDKENYEIFSSYMQRITKDKTFIDIHTLKKLGYIKGTTNLTAKVKDLCYLAGSYDKSGIYIPSEKGIEYSKIVKSNQVGVSFKECKGTKEERFNNCSKGFIYEKVSFNDLKDMLKGDYAYSPFEFKDGIRNKENTINKIKWIALDVDKSELTDEDIHNQLREFNHHIVRTSDKSNPYKFRILLELDSYVDLNDTQYKKFIQSISDFILIKVDILPKSQIYFSYSNRDILSVVDKNTIEVRDHLINSYIDKPSTDISTLTDKQKLSMLSSPTDTFYYAYNAKDGEGSCSLIRAAKHAKDLGMSKEQVLELMESINSYWIYPMERQRFENTILNYIRSWKF